MELSILFWTSNLVLWTFLIVIAFFLTNKSFFIKRGYNEAYAEFLKKDNTKRLLGVAVFLPLLELFSYFLVQNSGIFQSAENKLLWITLLSLAILIPIVILDNLITRRKIKKLALETKPEIVIDFNYKTLHLIFNYRWELATGILFFAYGLMVIKPLWTAYLHVVIPWFLYFSARGQVYSTRPMVRDGYQWIFIFIMLNHALVIFYQVRCFVLCYNQLLASELYTGYLIAALLICKFLLYSIHYPKFRRLLLE